MHYTKGFLNTVVWELAWLLYVNPLFCSNNFKIGPSRRENKGIKMIYDHEAAIF